MPMSRGLRLPRASAREEGRRGLASIPRGVGARVGTPSSGGRAVSGAATHGALTPSQSAPAVQYRGAAPGRRGGVLTRWSGQVAVARPSTADARALVQTPALRMALFPNDSTSWPHEANTGRIMHAPDGRPPTAERCDSSQVDFGASTQQALWPAVGL